MMSATTISAKPFYQPGASDEKLAKQSGLIGDPDNLPRWLRGSFSYRGLQYRNGIESGSGSPRYIKMQRDGTLLVQNSKSNLFVTVTLGLIDHQTTTSISREHYVGYRPNKRIGFYLGLMDGAYGIRIPDHITFSRSATGFAQNDQTHGLMVHYLNKRWEGALHPQLGNLEQASNTRMKGFSTWNEYALRPQTRLGFSAVQTRNDFRIRRAGAVHSRIGLKKGSSILAEYGHLNNKSLTSGAPAPTGQYWLFQSSSLITRGYNLLFTFESFADRSFGPAARTYRAGPSLQIFPMQRVEVRFDLLGSRSQSATSLNQERLLFLGQIHFLL